MHRAGCLEEIHTFGRSDQRESTDMMEAAGLAGQLFQLPIQADGITLKRGHIGIRVQGVKSTRRMPGRTRGEFGSFDQNDVFPSEFGEVINHAAADHTATYNDYLGMFSHILFSRLT
ncbi:hypothetical protein MnTg03_00047 [bacterium MnTg03]|nr:hypothetical protein MnTg03_00047 [bacterium MnTg03]